MLGERSGLDLVFYGQLGDDSYSASLRAAFPDAEFIAGRDAQYDFDMLRRSANIAPSISTFAWLAAWLSEAEKIYLPVGGIFSPVQHHNQCWCPVDDLSYEFVLMPYCKAVDIAAEFEQFKFQQHLIASTARWIDRNELRMIFDRAMVLLPHCPFVGGFDPAFYASRNPDIATTILKGEQTALEHYWRIGYQDKKRLPVDFNAKFYLNQYPEVAMKIAEGYYLDPLHHYMACGFSKSYLPK
jgi:hypothetical protein